MPQPRQGAVSNIDAARSSWTAFIITRNAVQRLRNSPIGRPLRHI
jgi:hypothetical protein